MAFNPLRYLRHASLEVLRSSVVLLAVGRSFFVEEAGVLGVGVDPEDHAREWRVF